MGPGSSVSVMDGSRRRRSRLNVGLVVGVVTLAVAACTGQSEATSAPPVTDSETGRIVGQPISVQAVGTEISADGTVTFTALGTVPSPCNEAMLGWEAPNQNNVLVGSAESWRDPNCTESDRSTPFQEKVQIPGLPDGDYEARLPGVDSIHFTLPNQGRIDGPVLVAPIPQPSDTEDMVAVVTGALVYDRSTDCLFVELGDRTPLVWPAETTWQANPPGVVLEHGTVLTPGSMISGRGAFLPLGTLEKQAGSTVANAATTCAGDGVQAAVFSYGSLITSQGG